MSSVKLHVVYAGRGDAMILEYTYNSRRFLVLLDGGPYFRQASAAGRHDKAPYWQYYFSALKDVWSQMGHARSAIPPFSPDAIFISHPHEDHYGGIERLLTAVGAIPFKAAPAAGDTFFFNGPIIVPNCRGQKAFNYLDKRLTALGFVPQDSDSGTINIGINLDWPSELVVYRKVDPAALHAAAADHGGPESFVVACREGL
jgi:glyoxylase-like metal-dependent hydrolase (beta-lactamase superfamily II)